MKRSKWNRTPMVEGAKPCDSLMIVAKKRWELAEAIIAGIYVASEELKASSNVQLYVRDDGWGNALVIREPVPEQFVLAILAALPDAELVPVDFGPTPTRALMTIGRYGVHMQSDPVFPGYVAPAEDSQRWHHFAERWDPDSSMTRYYEYRTQRKAKKNAAEKAVTPQKSAKLESLLFPQSAKPAPAPAEEPLTVQLPVDDTVTNH